MPDRQGATPASLGIWAEGMAFSRVSLRRITGGNFSHPACVPEMLFLYTPQPRGRVERLVPGAEFPVNRGRPRNASLGPDGLLEGETRKNGKSNRHRPRNHQLLHRHHGRQGAQGYRERGRRAHNPFHRRVYGRRRTSGRPAGKAPGGHQSRKHHLCSEAPDRPPLRRSGHREGQEARPLQDRKGRQWRRLGRGRRQEAVAQARSRR